MIGIDVARVKRWYAKTYPQYSGVGYQIEVTLMNQTGIDTAHELRGVDVNFTVTSYDVETNQVAHTISGIYNRMHYGGWNAHDNTSASLTEGE